MFHLFLQKTWHQITGTTFAPMPQKHHMCENASQFQLFGGANKDEGTWKIYQIAKIKIMPVKK